MQYIYVLFSMKDKRIYTGYTEDLQRRMADHLQGKVSSTRSRRPLLLVYYEACLEQADALHRERYLKTTWGKRYLTNRLRTSLEQLKD
jgi:putative endonuclease